VVKETEAKQTNNKITALKEQSKIILAENEELNKKVEELTSQLKQTKTELSQFINSPLSVQSSKFNTE